MLTHIDMGTARSRRLASLGEMVSGIVHEIRNPLGGIELYASLIRDQHPSEASRLAEEILHAVQRLQTTIAQLLSFAADARVVVERLPVACLLRDVTALVAPLFAKGTWRVALTVEPNLPPLDGDRILLTQALTNLVINAQEAMPHGGVVAIRVRRAKLFMLANACPQAIEIRVEDEGPGIAPADRERIFEPFFTTKHTGTGLGLALTHKIIGAHHGSIFVSDAPVRGSCFTVLLPLTGDANPVRTLATPSPGVTQDRQTERKYEETHCYS